MRKYLSYIIFILAFTSCKSLKSITAKDTSNAAGKSTTSGNKKDVRFLDDISVTPGGTTAPKTNSTAAKKKEVGKDKSIVIPASSFSNIESAAWLQIKYAIIMDVEVERLVNMPLLQQIDNWWGTSYCMGGSTERCIDCSAFTQTVMQSVYNISLPRVSKEQYDASERINPEDLREGDLVFFHTVSRGVSHVGIYLMNNKFVHASTSYGVTISDLNDAYWSSRFMGGGRVVK